MKPIRQIEAAEHMVASGTYSVKFARALLAVTRPECLLEVPSAKRLEATSKGARLMFEQETESLVKDLKSVEASYGMDILALTVICGYLDRLFGNSRIERHLKNYHPDILSSIISLLAELKGGKARKPESLAS
jgi:RepB plasmid partitioning protein